MTGESFRGEVIFTYDTGIISIKLLNKQLLNMCMGFNCPQECSCCGWYSLAVMVVSEDTEILC